MILTIDASIAVKWIVNEPGSDAALAYLPQWEAERLQWKHTYLAPALIALELHNTLARLHRRGFASLDQLLELQFALNCIGRLDPLDEPLIAEARKISFIAKRLDARSFGQTAVDLGKTFNIYDCVYIAHAKQNKSSLLTADAEQARMAQHFSVPVEFVPSS